MSRYDRAWLLRFVGGSEADALALPARIADRVPFTARQVVRGVPAVDERLRQPAITAMDRLLEGERLAPEDDGAVEAVVIPFGRPALTVIGDGDFAPPALPELSLVWEHRAALKPAIHATGRIETPGFAPIMSYCGTCLLVAPDVVLTNRHVAEHIAQRVGDTWHLNAAARATVNFAAHLDAAGPVSARVVAVTYVHDTLDVALARIAPAGTLPAPVRIAPSLPSGAPRVCATIGHPAFDPRCPVPLQQQVFGGLFDVKRVAPGYITGEDADRGLFDHDCSTLGGNSGSGVIVPNGTACGLHFAGEYLRRNVAVSLPPLAELLAARVER